MKKPLISVIVPVYNVEKYLNECIESVVNQTYKNLEIILVDDGSPDNCPEICDEWAIIDIRIKVIHKPNGGLSSARNAGMDVINGEYVMFVDSDDWIDKDMVEELYSSLLKNNSDISVCGLYYESSVSEKCNCYNFENGYYVFLNEQSVISLLLDDIRPEVCCKLYKSSLIKKVLFDTNIKYAEDVPFNYVVFKNSKSVVVINACKYHYRVNTGTSITSDYLPSARANSWKLFENIIDLSKDNKNIYNAAVWRFTYHTFGLYNRSIANRESKISYSTDIYNALKKYFNIIITCPYVSSKYRFALCQLIFSKNLYNFIYLNLKKFKEKN